MRSFIDQHRERFGVEPICKLLQVAPSAYWRMLPDSAIRHCAVPARGVMNF